MESFAWVSEEQSAVVGSTVGLFLELRDQEDWPHVHFEEFRPCPAKWHPRLEVWERFVEHDSSANRLGGVRRFWDVQHLVHCDWFRDYRPALPRDHSAADWQCVREVWIQRGVLVAQQREASVPMLQERVVLVLVLPFFSRFEERVDCVGPAVDFAPMELRPLASERVSDPACPLVPLIEAHSFAPRLFQAYQPWPPGPS